MPQLRLFRLDLECDLVLGEHAPAAVSECDAAVADLAPLVICPDRPPVALLATMGLRGRRELFRPRQPSRPLIIELGHFGLTLGPDVGEESLLGLVVCHASVDDRVVHLRHVVQ